MRAFEAGVCDALGIGMFVNYNMEKGTAWKEMLGEEGKKEKREKREKIHRSETVFFCLFCSNLIIYIFFFHHLFSFLYDH